MLAFIASRQQGGSQAVHVFAELAKRDGKVLPAKLFFIQICGAVPVLGSGVIHQISEVSYFSEHAKISCFTSTVRNILSHF